MPLLCDALSASTSGSTTAAAASNVTAAIVPDTLSPKLRLQLLF